MQRSNGSEDGNPRVVFGELLRLYRTRAGLSTDQLGSAVYLTGDMIAKIERGKRSASDKLVDALEALPELGSAGTLHLVWEQLREHLTGARPFPVWFDRWPDAEAAARTLRWFEPLIVPGLLQTEDYARALLRTRVGDSEDEIEAMVSARMKRQEILTREKPPTFWVIIDEGVLRRCIGAAGVMKEQLAQLAEMADRPDIVIQVIPSSTGAHQGLNGGAFVIADLAGAPSIAYQDTARAGQVLEGPDDIEALTFTWDTLRAEALPRAASADLIREVQETWT